ncbi:MAG: iron-sulfur cluster carrier protein ApbC [Planctomycetota bacterium]|nr:MAG: iron-sulfur cluster carrier protein ApbC [Planctomycetota bacterium]
MSNAIIEAITAQLSQVIDPDLGKDLVSLNMIRELRMEGSTALFHLVLTTAACPVKKELEDQCRERALSVDGVDAVEIAVSAEVPQKKKPDDVLPKVRHVFAVASGKGGVGKSTVTVNLACALAASGARVGLLDADIYGPSIPMMMGISREPYVANKQMIPLENHGVRMISMGFLVDPKAAMIWRGPMLMGAIRQFITDVAWGDLDYLLVDLPPGTGDVQMTLAQTVPLQGAVVVSTPQNIALLDAQRGVTMFNKLDIPILGIVENMSAFICPECGTSSPIFGVGGAQRYAEDEGLPFLGGIPLEPAVRECGDEGTPVVLAHPHSHSGRAFTSLAEQVASRISIEALTGEEIASA